MPCKLEPFLDKCNKNNLTPPLIILEMKNGLPELYLPSAEFGGPCSGCRPSFWSRGVQQSQAFSPGSPVSFDHPVHAHTSANIISCIGHDCSSNMDAFLSVQYHPMNLL